MGRLIDADAFIQELKEEIANLYLNALKGTPRMTDDLYNFIDRIENQPTFYDVEKVVEQIESKIKMAERIMVSTPHDELDRIANETAESFIAAYKETIEIVRKGGVE